MSADVFGEAVAGHLVSLSAEDTSAMLNVLFSKLHLQSDMDASQATQQIIIPMAKRASVQLQQVKTASHCSPPIQIFTPR